jgi:hypothetical protein
MLAHAWVINAERSVVHEKAFEEWPFTIGDETGD